jgi:hypothetical protein
MTMSVLCKEHKHPVFIASCVFLGAALDELEFFELMINQQTIWIDKNAMKKLNGKGVKMMIIDFRVLAMCAIPI